MPTVTIYDPATGEALESYQCKITVEQTDGQHPASKTLPDSDSWSQAGEVVGRRMGQYPPGESDERRSDLEWRGSEAGDGDYQKREG